MRSCLFMVALFVLGPGLGTGCWVEDGEAPSIPAETTATADVAADSDDELASVAQSIGTGSCVGKCGRRSSDCWCNTQCEAYGDCCSDYGPVCLGEALPGVAVRVDSVSDGDSIRLVGGERIRLDCVDAPESNQPYGRSAASDLRTLLSRGSVRLERDGRDYFGRTIGTLYVNGENVNQRLVRDGAGWNYDRYCGRRYQPDEDHARAEQRGLWALPKPIAPWNWRRGRR